MEEGLIGAAAEEVAAVAPARRQPQIYSVAQHLAIINKNVVYLHVDIEWVSVEAGIVQISCIPMDADLNMLAGIFNEYVRPPDGVEWDANSCASHKLSKDDPRITGAKGVLVVWPLFKSFLKSPNNCTEVYCICPIG